MCFSPTASFASSAVLLIVGIATFKKAAKDNEKLFASIPLLFSAQQLVEGLLWLTLLHGMTGKIPFGLTQIYAVFAGMIWPTIVPLSIFHMELSGPRKFPMFVAVVIGYALAAYAFYVITQIGITSGIRNACISYNYAGDTLYYRQLMAGYVAATCLPFLFVRDRILHGIGFLFFMALAVSLYLYKFSFVSIWCFFAALISGGIYFYFREEEAEAKSIAKSEEFMPPVLD